MGGEGVKQGVEDIISFPHCRRQYADETMKDGEKKSSCQSPSILFISQSTVPPPAKKEKSQRTLQQQRECALCSAKLCQLHNQKPFRRPREGKTEQTLLKRTLSGKYDLGCARRENKFLTLQINPTLESIFMECLITLTFRHVLKANLHWQSTQL